MALDMWLWLTSMYDGPGFIVIYVPLAWSNVVKGTAGKDCE